MVWWAVCLFALVAAEPSHREKGAGLADLAGRAGGKAKARAGVSLDQTLRWKQQEEDSAEVEALNDITKLDGKPNPRNACSEGLNYVRDLIISKVKDWGLKEMGSDGYRFTVPGTKDPQYCTDGITNIIAGIEGTDDDLKDEYILISAHLDGPMNEGPSEADGLGDTDDSYDDGSAVAAGMALAAHFAENPTKRSLLFFFSDGEEGFSGIAAPEDWMAEKCESGVFEKCSNYPIGFTAFVANPTVDLRKVKLAVAMDPLGAPGIKGSDFVALLGTETTPKLQELLEETWQGDLVKPMFVNRMYASTSYTDADTIAKNFKPTCFSRDNCFYGVPFVWVAQAGFHKYHGGQHVSLVDIMNQIPGASFPKTQASYALDTRKTFDAKALEKVTQELQTVIQRLADKAEVSTLAYNGKVYERIKAAAETCPGGKPVCGFSLQDGINNKKVYDFLAEALSQPEAVTTIPADIAQETVKICHMMSGTLSQIIDRYSDAEDPSQVIPAELAQTMPPILASLVMGLDFFASGPTRHFLA